MALIEVRMSGIDSPRWTEREFHPVLARIAAEYGGNCFVVLRSSTSYLGVMGISVGVFLTTTRAPAASAWPASHFQSVP